MMVDASLEHKLSKKRKMLVTYFVFQISVVILLANNMSVPREHLVAAAPITVIQRTMQ